MAEEDLDERERALARYESLATAANLDVFRADADGQLRTDMPGWRAQTGQSPDAVEGTGWLSAVHPDHRERVARTWEAAVRTGTVYECEYPILTADGATRTVFARAVPMVEDGVVREWVGTSADVTAEREARAELQRISDLEAEAQRRAEAATERMRLVASVSRRLVEVGGSVERIVEALLDAAVPGVADLSVVHLVAHDGIEGAGTRAADPATAAALEAHLRQLAVGDTDAAGAAEAIRTRQAQRVDGGGGAHPWHSMVTVPLLVRDRTLGAWSVGRSVGAPFSAEDLDLVEDLANRVASALANAQLQGRLRELATVAAAVNAAPDVHTALHIVTRAARTIVGANQAVTSMTTTSGWSQAISSVSLSDRYASWRTYDVPPDGSGIYATVCVDQRPVRLTQAELEAHPDWHGFGDQAQAHPPMNGWLAAPLTAPDGTNLGLIQASDRVGGQFTDEDEATMVQLAGIAAGAIHRLRILAERSRIADALQQPLSPPEQPAIPGFDIAARYLPFGEEMDVGGDFYDLFELPDGAWGIVLGDVCGKGPEAAAVAGLTRQTVWASCQHTSDASGVLATLNRALLRSGSERFSTLIFAVLRTGEDPPTLDVASAGHPLPVVVRADRSVERPGGLGLPVGLFDHATYTSERTTLHPGDLVTFYTDGLSEAGGALAVPDDELESQVVATASGASQAVVDRLVAAAVERAPDGLRDDLAVLALRVPSAVGRTPEAAPPADAHEVEIDAGAEATREARHWVCDLASILALDDIVDDLELVTAELVTNAVLHARTDVRVTLRPLTAGARIEVRDGAPDRLPVTSGTGLLELLELDDLDDLESGLTALDTETMTGRGMTLVGAIADRWGVDVGDTSKVVWAELATGSSEGAPEEPVEEQPGTPERTVPGHRIRIPGVPVRLVLTAAAHMDDLVRELRVATLPETLPPDFADVAAQFVAMTAVARDPFRTAARAAVDRRERLLEVSFDLPPGGVAALRGFFDVVERVAELSERGELLSLAPPPEVTEFRRWCIDEMARQVEGRHPQPCPFPVVPPDDPSILMDEEAVAAGARDVLASDAVPAWLAEAEAALELATDVAEVNHAVVTASRHAGIVHGSLCLLADDGVTLEISADVGYGAQIRTEWSTFPVTADVPASEVVRTRRPIFLASVAELHARFPVLASTGTISDGALAVLPIRRGAMVLGFRDHHRFSAADRRVLSSLADLASAAVDRVS